MTEYGFIFNLCQQTLAGVSHSRHSKHGKSTTEIITSVRIKGKPKNI